MSLIDFAGKLLQNPASAQEFLSDPESALRAAGLDGVTPEDVRSVLPGVSDAIPSDHPLQSFIQPEFAAPTPDPDARHYYQLGDGDKVLNGVAGQSILRPDGSSVLVGSDDVIVPADGKVIVLQPGDEAIPGFAGMIVRHADGTVTDAGIDTILVPQDQVYVPAGGAEADTSAGGGGLVGDDDWRYLSPEPDPEQNENYSPDGVPSAPGDSGGSVSEVVSTGRQPEWDPASRSQIGAGDLSSYDDTVIDPGSASVDVPTDIDPDNSGNAYDPDQIDDGSGIAPADTTLVGDCQGDEYIDVDASVQPIGEDSGNVYVEAPFDQGPIVH